VEGFLTEKGFSLAVKGLIGDVILLLEIKISGACRSFSWWLATRARDQSQTYAGN